jgi:formate hydrogenlyase subunit 4
MLGLGAMGSVGAAAGQALVLVLLAPLIQGLIQRLKAALQGRRGPGVLQPYFTLAKLWRRQDVRPEPASWIFALAPRAALGLVLAAGMAVPLAWSPAPLGWGGDFIVVAGLLAMERFVLGLAGLDAGTPFGGLGSSRESAVGALVEPALFALALPWLVLAGSTAWPALVSASASAAPASVVRFFGLAAALIVALAETGRLPVDNPDTHLELTMIHEAMVLEYSGPQLALVSLAQMSKQLLVIALVADLLLPWGMGLAALAPLAAAAKWAALAAGLGVAESLSAKLRFFRLPGYLGAATALSSAAAVLQVWGVR